jgi:putative transposase
VATYYELFRSLKGRGFSGVELVVSDDHESIKATVARHFQGASHQRWQVHCPRNLLGMVETTSVRNLLPIYAGPSRTR